MTETIKEMQDRWTVNMAARYGAGHPRAGERIADVDAKYARDQFELGVRISDLIKAQAAQPRINEQQLQWLNRLQGAMTKEKLEQRNAAGEVVVPGEPSKRLYEPGSEYQRRLDKLRVRHENGENLSAEMATVEANFTRVGAELGPDFSEPTHQQRVGAREAGMGSFGPPSHVRALPTGQPTNTNMGGVV